METDLYKQLHQDSKDNNDNNSCTVLAGCVAFDLTYTKGNKLMTQYADRTHRRGLYRRDSIRGYKAINRFLNTPNKFNIKVFDTRDIKSKFTDGKTMTVNNCMEYLNPKKRYILYTTNHAIGVKNGIVHDWTHGSKRRIQDIVEVTCNDEVQVKPKEKVFKMGGFGAILDNL
tara:strand:- start:658 stop:1173 length:516 start_codon:yes stop_codon:yes gene_type:complete